MSELQKQTALNVTETEGKTALGAGDCALVVTAAGELQFMMPHFEEDELDLPISRLAMALAAVANKLLDDEWVNALMAEAYPPENDGEDTDEGDHHHADNKG